MVETLSTFNKYIILSYDVFIAHRLSYILSLYQVPHSIYFKRNIFNDSIYADDRMMICEICVENPDILFDEIKHYFKKHHDLVAIYTKDKFPEEKINLWDWSA